MGISRGPETSVTDGLIYYIDPMNERSYTSGNYIYDLTKSKYVTQFMDGATASSTYGNEFITFDGLNDRLHILNSYNSLAWTQDGSRGMQQQSVDLWVNCYNDSTGNIYSKPWNGNGGYNHRIANTGVFVGCGTPISGISLNYSGINLTSINGWTNVVSMVDASNIYIYINGKFNRQAAHNLVGGPTTTYASSTGYVSTIMGIYPYGPGYGGASSNFTAGTIGTVKIYNKILTADEVLRNYKSLKDRYI